jgi:NAD(P)-dependent dehydrogenase (short-subunit alcohol dehydrogenase family)
MAASPAPRAVAVSSISSLGPYDEALVALCLSGDEAGATAAAGGKDPLALYGSAKHALNRWARRASCEARWAGAGIVLNVVAPGVIDTPAAAWLLATPELREASVARTPLKVAFPGPAERMAELLAWCVSADNALMTGQVLFADAGFEALARGDQRW